MRYFKDTTAVKRFCSALVNDFESGTIDEKKYRALLRGAELLLKCHVQLYYEQKLGDLPATIDELKLEIESMKSDSYHYRGAVNE